MSKKYNITDTRAASFPIPEKGQAIYWDEKQSGLGLRVTANGARSWIVQGYVNGKSKRFTLGLLDELDYKEAREEDNVAQHEDKGAALASEDVHENDDLCRRPASCALAAD